MNNTKSHYFHFTLGPVQGFVSQARRTRDFWAGSFLLSWLSAVAIKAVKHQGGDILFPKENNDFLAFLEGKGEEGKEPKQGNIPNRFKAKIANIDDFIPEQVIESVQEAWIALADYIWEKDIIPLCEKSDKTGVIWDRQISHFWDMNWVITDDFEDSSALDRRKNWKTYFPPDEPGVKCAIMNGWQELSGVSTPNRKEMEAQFWQPLRSKDENGIKNDLAENEALCAIAFVKRRFSRYFKDFKHTMTQGWTLEGWSVPGGVPSVAYMAAVHWLKDAVNHVDRELLNSFSIEAKNLTGEYGEWDTDIKCLKDVGGSHYFKSLDGNVFYKNNLENSSMYADKKHSQAKKVLAILKKINAIDNLAPVSPFYAILMMDGDSLGKNMSDINKQDAITQSLECFTKGVPDIVYQNNGFLIYAGGDDVLALMPLEDAIPCAISLRSHYEKSFDRDRSIKTTLSGAIEFVHIKTQLTKVLKDAHQLLDGIAKEKTGRDALAIRVWKPGGLHLQWSQPWRIALFDNIDGNKTSYLEVLVKQFQDNDLEDEHFSSNFLFKIRQRFDLLNPSLNSDGKEGNDGVFDDNDQIISLMAMEYLNSGNTSLSKIKNAKERVDKAKDYVYPLLKQCRPVFRDIDKSDTNDWKKSQSLKSDAALLVRFLAHKGIER